MSTFRDRALSRVMDSYIASLSLPDDLAGKIEVANRDLYNGPVYLDEVGNECSCFDPFASQINFSALCSEIGDALDCVSDIWIDIDCEDYFDTEPEAEMIDGEVYEPDYSSIYKVEARDIIRHICGRELARYVS